MLGPLFLEICPEKVLLHLDADGVARWGSLPVSKVWAARHGHARDEVGPVGRCYRGRPASPRC